MQERVSSRGSALVGSTLLIGALLAGGGPAYAHSDPDIATTIAPTPASVTLASAELPTFASYQVTLKHNNRYNLLRPVYFTASTTVLDSAGAPVAGQTAAIQVASLPAGCTAPTATTVKCTFTNGLANANSVLALAITVKTPTAGAKIGFYSQTSWKDCDRLESTPATTVYTLLTAPDPMAVNSYVPAGGGTLYTGTGSGIATKDDPWTTTVKLPTTAPATSAQVLETVAPSTCAPNLLTCNSSALTIPGTFDNLEITLRRDATTIAKHANIASAHVQYTDPAHPAAGIVYPLDVPACTDTTYGALPRSGVPCIASRKAYPAKDDDDCDPRDRRSRHPPPVVPTTGFEGDWEFVIKAVDNGRYIN